MALVLDGSAGVSGVDGTASNPSYEGTDSNTGIFFPAADTVAIGTGGTEALRVNSSQQLGFGVTPSPWGGGYKGFDIAGNGAINTANSLFNITANAYWNGTNWIYSSTDYASRMRQYQGAFAWYNAPSGTAGNAITFTQAMTLDASGNLLVGITSAFLTSRVSIESANSNNSRITQNIFNTAATSTNRTDNRIVRVASNASNADVALQLTDSVTNNYFFGGNNGGAYVSANSNGVRLSNGGTSWASDSDENLKTDLVPIADAANKVASLRAVTGRYKTDAEGVSRAFLIAQDVQAVLPEAVFDEQGTLMLAYTETIPLLVAAIKELKAELDATKAEIAALKAQP